MPTSSDFGSTGHPPELWSELEKLVPGKTRVSTPEDAIDEVLPFRVVAPVDQQQLISVLSWANAHRLSVAVRGSGSKLHWGNIPARLDLILSVEKLPRTIEHVWQDMTVTASASVGMGPLQEELARNGQRLPLDILWPQRATVGGVIAANDNGPLRLRFGSVRDLILGVNVVLADGATARSGGRVVKNVAGYDLPKLFAGSFGTLGVITEATFRTYPLPHSVLHVSIAFTDVRSACKFMIEVADSVLTPASMQLRIGTFGTCVDLRFEGLRSGIEAQIERLRAPSSVSVSAESPAGCWSRESLWCGAEPSFVAKFSALPTAMEECVQSIRTYAPNSVIIVQSIGIGFCRVEAEAPETHGRIFRELRSAIRQLGGTLVLLHAPLELKKSLDVFGDHYSALPLMRRVKQQFDPMGTLSPGRFIGGI